MSIFLADVISITDRKHKNSNVYEVFKSLCDLKRIKGIKKN